MLGRPGGREGISTGSSRRGKIWKEEGGRILLRVGKGRWGGDVAGTKAKRKGS